MTLHQTWLSSVAPLLTPPERELLARAYLRPATPLPVQLPEPELQVAADTLARLRLLVPAGETLCPQPDLRQVDWEALRQRCLPQPAAEPCPPAWRTRTESNAHVLAQLIHAFESLTGGTAPQAASSREHFRRTMEWTRPLWTIFSAVHGDHERFSQILQQGLATARREGRAVEQPLDLREACLRLVPEKPAAGR